VIDTDAAVAGMDAAFAFPLVVPNLATGAGVDGPGVVGYGEIQNAIDLQWRGFDLDTKGTAAGTGLGMIEPGEFQVAYIAGVDLIESAEAAARVITVVGGPTSLVRMDDRRGIETLGEDSEGARDEQ